MAQPGTDLWPLAWHTGISLTSFPRAIPWTLQYNRKFINSLHLHVAITRFQNKNNYGEKNTDYTSQCSWLLSGVLRPERKTRVMQAAFQHNKGHKIPPAISPVSAVNLSQVVGDLSRQY